ncbi:MAG: exonuclease domain-containing protein [Cellulosilyticaceae bacterium]
MRSYVVVDIETTGTQPLKSDIIEIGAVYIENHQVVKKYSSLVKPTQEISEYIESITGINNEMVANERPIGEVLPEFLAFCGDVPLVGHNLIVFDYRMLKVKATRLGLPFSKEAVDTLIVSRKLLADLPSRKLGDLCGYYGIDLVNAHRAYDDAYATYLLYEKLYEDFGSSEPELFVPERLTWELPEFVPITAKQKSFLLKLCEMHKIVLAQDIKSYSKSDASRQIDAIIREYGRG